ncbi:MAG: hypothetical protein PHP82_02300 [Candidatus ainarchaeum sp.]|nr:hypothetical protein [Candidatus ainarchaeum sp.]
MKKRFFTLFLIIILISCSVSAEGYNVWLHNVNIVIDTDGSSEITEKFHLSFNTEEDKINFRKTSIELGSDLKKFEDFDEMFSPTIGLNNIINGKITYGEGEDNYLEIKYGLADTLMAKGKETTLVEEYSIKANYLNKLFQSGLWIIPDNTTIVVELPPGAEIRETVSPDAIIDSIGTRKTITWSGYKSANKLNIKYVLWKKINPIFDLNKFTNFLFRTNEGLIIIGILLFVIGAIIWKRKYFSSKIENFVENNTVFEEE